jgi:hypothetical protein
MFLSFTSIINLFIFFFCGRKSTTKCIEYVLNVLAQVVVADSSCYRAFNG